MSMGHIAVLLFCLILALPAGAKSLYVIDQLLIGVHETKDRTSAILELLPSGTRLDVVKQEGDLVHVKTPGGTLGWVDGKYLVSEKPARNSLNELEAQHQKDKESLAAARRELKALQARKGSAMDQKSRQELESLRSENAELKETIASAEVQLTELARARAELEAASEAEQSSPAISLSIRQAALEPVTWAVLGGVLVLGFVLGGYLMDYRQRRRHGGFRI